MEHRPIGTHCILELEGCAPRKLNDLNLLVRVVREAAARGGAELLDINSHRFTPQGVTVLALLSESHMSVHTWPEHRYAAADVFTCGNQVQPMRACRYLVDALGASRGALTIVRRGHDIEPEKTEVVVSPSRLDPELREEVEACILQ